MKDYFQLLGGIALFVGIAYFVWVLFIPMAIGGKMVEREVLEQSPQYVISQRTALVRLNREYRESTDSAQKKLLLNEMCDIESKIPSTEIPQDVLITLGGC